jgi:hypothetical protein
MPATRAAVGSRVKERRPAFSDDAIVEDRDGDPDNTVAFRDGPCCLGVENHIAVTVNLSPVAHPLEAQI